jgi:hypothetical protein
MNPVETKADRTRTFNPSLKKKAAIAIHQWHDKVLIQQGILAGEFKQSTAVRQRH